MALFVRQLSFATTADSLRALFERIAPVLEVRVPVDNAVAGGGVYKNKGFGFVTFGSEEDAATAIRELNGTYFEGKNIAVTLSDKQQRQPAVSSYPPRSSRDRSPRSTGRRDRSPRSFPRGGGTTSTSSTTLEGKIFVSGLPASTTEDQLAEYFSASGRIARKRQARGYPDQWPPNIKLYVDDRGVFRGEALVAYEDPNAAATAPGFYHGTDFYGSTISVQLAKRDY